MAEELIGNLGYGAPAGPPALWAHESDTKHQKLLECVLTRNSKLYLGKVYTEEQLAKLNEEEVEKLFNNYEAKLSGQMVKSLGRSIINMYSMGVCAALGITNQDALSEDLESDRSFPKLCSSKIYLGAVLQIRFILSSLKRWNNYEQTLFIRT